MGSNPTATALTCSDARPRFPSGPGIAVLVSVLVSVAFLGWEAAMTANDAGGAVDERNRLILEEARAASGQQRDDLQKPRDRISTLLSASGLVAAFFGALTLCNGAELTGWVYAGAACVAAVALIAICIHFPARYIFTNDARVLLDEWSLDEHDADAWARYLAEYLCDNYEKNTKRITRLTLTYAVALGAFTLEVTLLGLDLALR